MIRIKKKYFYSIHILLISDLPNFRKFDWRQPGAIDRITGQASSMDDEETEKEVVEGYKLDISEAKRLLDKAEKKIGNVYLNLVPMGENGCLSWRLWGDLELKTVQKIKNGAEIIKNF